MKSFRVVDGRKTGHAVSAAAFLFRGVGCILHRDRRTGTSPDSGREEHTHRKDPGCPRLGRRLVDSRGWKTSSHAGA